MERRSDGLHLTTEEASGGATPGVMRYVLAASLLLAIGLLSAVWITGAIST